MVGAAASPVKPTTSGWKLNGAATEATAATDGGTVAAAASDGGAAAPDAHDEDTASTLAIRTPQQSNRDFMSVEEYKAYRSPLGCGSPSSLVAGLVNLQVDALIKF